MFLRCKVRRKDGKQHRYWSVVENTRVAGGAWCSDMCCTWAKSTTRRSWRAGGRLDRPRQAVAVAVAPTATVGRMLVGAAAVARAAARSVLVEAAGREP